MKNYWKLLVLRCLCLQKVPIQGFTIVPSSHRTAACAVSKDSSKLCQTNESRNHQRDDANDSVTLPQSGLLDRREAMILSLIGACSLPTRASAAETTTTQASSSSSSTSSNTFVAPVTQKVFMNVRISRADGTFYVRDEEENEDDKVLYAKLVIGLFGTVAPVNVQRFLSYIPGAIIPSTKNSKNDDEDVDDMLSLPSYAQSSFPSLDQATGLLNAGVIPALHVTEFNGAAALQYGGRLLPAPLWLESSSARSSATNSGSASTARVSHTAAKGLLTHRQLDVTPAFQISTRVADSETARLLDATNVVFGQVVLWDTADPSASAFLRRLQDIPTYAASRPASSTALDEGSAVNAVTSSLYRAQRDFFRGAAQTLGDQRLGNIYEGKFLRRVEVTQIGLLDA